MKLETDILVVGGGIGGVVLAELLTRTGKRALVVERSLGPPPFLRPELLWPAAVQTLFSLRDRAEWMKDSFQPVGGIVIDFRGQLRPAITSANLEAAGVQPYFENPNQTRESLLKHCHVEVRRGVEVVSLVSEAGAIRGVEARDRQSGEAISISAGLTVGDDGTDSHVREACGIEISLKPFPADFFVCGLPWPASWARGVAHILFPPRDDDSGLVAVGFMPVPGPLAATVAVVCSDRAGDATALSAAWQSMVATAESAPDEIRVADFPGNFTRIGRRWGHAARYGAPGAVLIGDALHPVSPAGGQGANMAIADAVALSQLIVAGGPDLARDYEALRRAPNERGLRPTRISALMFQALDNRLASAAAGFLLPRFLGIPGLVPTILRTLASGSANSC